MHPFPSGHIPFVEAAIYLVKSYRTPQSLFRSARASCTTYYLWWTRAPARAKNLDTYIQAYMPHNSLGDSPNHSTVQYSLVLPSTIYYCPVQSSTAQYILVPPSTV